MPIWPLGGCSNTDTLQCKCEFFPLHSTTTFLTVCRISCLGLIWQNGIQVHRTDYLNGGTALHFAALHGHARCLRLVLADYVPSVPNFCTLVNHKSSEEDSAADFDHEYAG